MLALFIVFSVAMGSRKRRSVHSAEEAPRKRWTPLESRRRAVAKKWHERYKAAKLRRVINSRGAASSGLRRSSRLVIPYECCRSGAIIMSGEHIGQPCQKVCSLFYRRADCGELYCTWCLEAKDKEDGVSESWAVTLKDVRGLCLYVTHSTTISTIYVCSPVISIVRFCAQLRSRSAI